MIPFPMRGHPASGSCQGLIERARSRILQHLSTVVDTESPVALLDFPEYNNVGDSAIWMGEVVALWALGIPGPVYAASQRDFQREELQRRLPDGTILLSGGGNLGDLYPSHQRFREEVITAFPDHRIVILPQSIHFRSERALDRARRTFASHPDLHLFVRTARSRDIARRHLPVPVTLCPDMSFALGPLPHVAPAGRRRLMLMRQDAEARPRDAGFRSSSGVDQVDWGTADSLPGRWEALFGWMRWLMGETSGIVMRGLGSYLNDARTRTAWARLLRGIRILSGREFVVTDRLHGHILALQMGIPHAVLDNSYGKNHAYVETWTDGCPLVRRVGHATPGRATVRRPPRIEPRAPRHAAVADRRDD